MPLDDDHGGLPPQWNGDPSRFDSYREEVRIWSLSIDLTSKGCVAARLVRRLTGSARRIGLAMSDAKLMGSADDPRSGINLLLQRLSALSPDSVSRGGSRMRELFREERYKGRRGERFADWLTRFEKGAEDLAADGVDLSSTGSLAG